MSEHLNLVTAAKLLSVEGAPEVRSVDRYETVDIDSTHYALFHPPNLTPLRFAHDPENGALQLCSWKGNPVGPLRFSEIGTKYMIMYSNSTKPLERPKPSFRSARVRAGRDLTYGDAVSMGVEPTLPVV